MEEVNDEYLKTRKIDDIDMTVRLGNFLHNCAIYNLFDLKEKKAEELLSYRTCGRKTLREIREILKKENLALKDDILLTDEEHKKFILSIPDIIRSYKKDIEEMKKGLDVLQRQLDQIIMSLEE